MVYSITKVFGRALNRSHLSLNCSSGKNLTVWCYMDQILYGLLSGRENSLDNVQLSSKVCIWCALTQGFALRIP